MVNVFRRFARRATSSGSAAVDTSANDSNTVSHEQGLRRSTSFSSSKRSRHAPVEEPSPRRLVMVSDTADFDPSITHRFQAEGFDVTFIGFVCSGDSERDRKALENAVHEKEDELEAGERYAIVAYNRPAYYLLGSHHLTTSNTNPFPRLCALIAYYPLTSTDQWTRDSHPNSLNFDHGPSCTSTASTFNPGSSTTYLPIQIHLPGHEPKPSTFWPWIGISPSEGDMTHNKRHRCHVYAYPNAKAGFAERNVDPEENRQLHDEDRVSSRLAWSRALGCLRRAFGVGGKWAVVDIETVWEEYWRRLMDGLDERRGREEGIGGGGDDDQAARSGEESGSVLEMMVSRGVEHDGSFLGRMDLHAGDGPSVECVPTKAGGSDTHTLRSFFADVFIPNGPSSQDIQLLSRTVGADQIVDEISFSFRHTAEVPWLLPGVSPTNQQIQVVLVVVASFCSNKIVHQSLYWDQASVLVQAGLLDPGLVPQMKLEKKV